MITRSRRQVEETPPTPKTPKRQKKQPSVESTDRIPVSRDTEDDSISRAKLEKLYTDIKSTPNFSAKIADFLRTNELHSTHRRIIKKQFPRRKVVARFPYDLFMADLIEYKNYEYINNRYRYVLLVIDCFSRFVWTAPMKKKNQDCTAEAFESIFADFDRFPINLVTDDGKEFFNTKVNMIFRTYGINHYSTPTKTKMKASMAERAIRTIKSRLQKIFVSKKRNRWIDVLQDITKNYNSTPHRSIGMAPSQVNDANRKRIYKRLYPNETITVVCKLKIGDKVRTLVDKDQFEKGYTQNWTTQIFVVDSIRQSNAVCYYKLKSLDNKDIPGIFYYYQLNLVSRDDNQPERNSKQ